MQMRIFQFISNIFQMIVSYHSISLVSGTYRSKRIFTNTTRKGTAMEHNPYGYDKRISWQTPQNQPYNNGYPGTSINWPTAEKQATRPQQAHGRGSQMP